MTTEVNIKITPVGDEVVLSRRDWGKVMRWMKRHGTRIDVGRDAIKKAKALERTPRKAGKDKRR